MSFCLVAVHSVYWVTGALGLEIHSGPELSQQCRGKGPSRALRWPRNSVQRPRKVRNAIDWQGIPWWLERISVVVWEWMKRVWDMGRVWSPNLQFCRYPGHYIQLNAVHRGWVEELHRAAFCQVSPPTGYCPTREFIGDGWSAWGSVWDTSRKLGRLSSKEGETDLNGIWLRFGAASLLDCCPLNSKSLNRSKLYPNS
jgi:hypothetical protein